NIRRNLMADNNALGVTKAMVTMTIRLISVFICMDYTPHPTPNGPEISHVGNAHPTEYQGF
ncbi:MAG: hypothetical protein MJA27_21905, partial [Pseudanabaenales cyanobacterium]|nr:hypothetical protein [Pseudanabaenales cyanobacterium]